MTFSVGFAFRFWCFFFCFFVDKSLFSAQKWAFFGLFQKVINNLPACLFFLSFPLCLRLSALFLARSLPLSLPFAHQRFGGVGGAVFGCFFGFGFGFFECFFWVFGVGLFGVGLVRFWGSFWLFFGLLGWLVSGAGFSIFLQIF